MLVKVLLNRCWSQRLLWTFVDFTFMILTTVNNHKCLSQEVISNFAEIQMYVYMYICLSVSLYIGVCMRMFMSVCMHVCICVPICEYMCMYRIKKLRVNEIDSSNGFPIVC